MLLLPVLLLGFPSAVTGSGYLWAVLGAYALAKGVEWQDAALLQVLGQVSGHSLKHLAAAAAGCLVLLALERRTVRSAAPGTGR
jgi:hypothetical protein